MAVKIAPNAPQAARISGSVCQTALAWIIEGEKQYNVSASNPPAFPQRRRATYHNEAPRKTPQARKGSRGSQRQLGEDAETSRRCGHASKGADVTSARSGDCSTSKPFARGASLGRDVAGGSGEGAPRAP